MFGQRLVARRLCGKRMETVTQQPIKNFFEVPRVSPGAHPLTKKPEDSGYEIGILLSAAGDITTELRY